MARKFKVKMAEIYKIVCKFCQNGENVKKLMEKYQKWQKQMIKIAIKWPDKNVKVDR